MKLPVKWLAAGAVIAAVAAIAVAQRGRPEPVSARSPEPGSLPLVTRFARQAGVSGLRTLVRAGSGDKTVRIVTGHDSSGSSCWTVSAAGGSVAGPFRCGSLPAPHGALAVFPDISGDPGSKEATAVTLVGLAGPNVGSVEAKLLDGSTRELRLRKGTFGFSATSPAALPTAVRAYSRTGALLAERTLRLTAGPGCTATNCLVPTP
jgi:hypothetical protein